MINKKTIVTDELRDSLFTQFGKETLKDRYLLEGESLQGLFARVSAAYADSEEHGQRLYDYMSRFWFMPATPVLSNGGTDRGLPISCFLNEAEDSMEGIADLWYENVFLAANGGGIGSYWGNIRSIGEGVRDRGQTSGVVPFLRVQDSLTLAVSQGALRRGSAAVYLPVSHPEIEEFVEIRRPTGGDPNRKALNLHHAVVISDDFMEAVANNSDWHLRSPKTGKVLKTLSARNLWIKMLTARIEIGEPYFLFIDNVNKQRPEVYKKLDIKVKTSNLCNEIMLTTGKDYRGRDRTAVCCLSSLNLEYYDAWKDEPQFIADIMAFLDNVLEDFIKRAPSSLEKAAYSAYRERSVGLGVMGFHSFLQKKGIPFGSVAAKSWNLNIFKQIKKEVDLASISLAEIKGPCPDAQDAGLRERFAHKMAIAPTASISIITGNTSAGIEPWVSNAYTHKTLSGSFTVKNKFLEQCLESHGRNNEKTWANIMTNKGSVQHLDFLSDDEKETFKTAFELDQNWLVEHAADRGPFVCQGQSLNVFLPADVNKVDLHKLHYNGWKRGIKGFYYCRSQSMQRADVVTTGNHKPDTQPKEYEECLACQ